MSYALTVAMCTRNRAELLACGLERLVTHWAPLREQCELLVVDNGSTDATREVLCSAVSRWSLRAVHEPQPGLSHARNHAVRAACGAWVVFTDDDMAWADGWLVAWLRAANQVQGPGWMGGVVRTDWRGPVPHWLKDNTLAFLDGVLARHDLGRGDGPYLPPDPWPIGGNFAIHREAFVRAGPFRTDLGHQGSSRGLGEETDWLRRAASMGMGGWHVADAVAFHPVELERLRLRALYRHGVASGVAEVRMHAGRAPGSIWRAGWALMRGARQLCLGRGDRFRQCVVNAGIEVGARREQRGRRKSAAAGNSA